MEEKKLKGFIHQLCEINETDKESLFQLMDKYYSINREGFFSDLARKNFAIVLRDESDIIRGFTTIMMFDGNIDDNHFRVLFSGDTIIEKEFWGSLELPKIWGKFMIEQIKSSPDKPLYWFLISSGYKTYRFLPVFFREYYPSSERETPPESASIINYIGKKLFGERFSPETGIIKLENPTPLKDGVADLSEERTKDRHISFFLSKNPGYIHGDELACLARLEMDNIKPFMRRVLK
ncbi:MAG: hypothetical protein HQM10_21600 [Candidatus Riflebacteria bacterium]|nr:hypothetical protein [Candidatus Riflebacteria bacterium]